MKTYIISYLRERQVPHFENGLTDIENTRVQDLFKGKVLQSFYMNKNKTKVWLIAEMPSKFDVLELVASFQLMNPNEVEMEEVYS
jgi:hypothetical protein